MAELKCNASFPLVPSIISKLEELAKVYDVSRAEIGRRAFAEFIAREKKKGTVN